MPSQFPATGRSPSSANRNLPLRDAEVVRQAHAVSAFVTLGSPLGIRNLIFDRLMPAPEKGRGQWPGVKAWTNVADVHDLVALRKELAPSFGDVRDVRIDNGATAHDVRPYLTARETWLAAAAEFGS